MKCLDHDFFKRNTDLATINIQDQCQVETFEAYFIYIIEYN